MGPNDVYTFKTSKPFDEEITEKIREITGKEPKDITDQGPVFPAEKNPVLENADKA